MTKLAHSLLTDALEDIQSRRAIYKHNHRGETERTPEYRLTLAQFDAEEAETIQQLAALDMPRLPDTESRISHISTAVMALNGLFEAHKVELRSDIDSIARSLASWQASELESSAGIERVRSHVRAHQLVIMQGGTITDEQLDELLEITEKALFDLLVCRKVQNR